MFAIGEFSKITGLTVKTLRFYHDKGLLVPVWIDEKTGYRFYNPHQVDKARVITQLRGLEFSLEEIREILANHEDEADVVDFFERQRTQLEERMRKYRWVVTSLDTLIQKEKEARMTLKNSTFEIEEKTLEPMLVAGIRMRGWYGDCGKGFAKIGRAMGRHISGKPFLLHYDTEYKEGEADFEACMPLRKAVAADGIAVRELPGGQCFSLLYRGPYKKIGPSYAKLLTRIKEKGREAIVPTREVYIKGPGMIFKGNPKNYLTELQILVR